MVVWVLSLLPNFLNPAVVKEVGGSCVALVKAGLLSVSMIRPTHTETNSPPTWQQAFDSECDACVLIMASTGSFILIEVGNLISYITGATLNYSILKKNP